MDLFRSVRALGRSALAALSLVGLTATFRVFTWIYY